MNVCHMLLSCPWFDTNQVWYHSVLYVYYFICRHKKYNLHIRTRSTFLKKTLKSSPVVPIVTPICTSNVLSVGVSTYISREHIKSPNSIINVPDDIDVLECATHIIIGS